MKKSLYLIAVCKPFSLYPEGRYEVMIDTKRGLLVWDNIGEIWTSCHNLKP